MSFPRYSSYKDSGVEWLGEVPAHWTMSRLGFESWVRARLGWKGLKAEEYVDDGYILLATPNIKGREIDFEEVNYINEQRYEESPEIKLQEKDVLLAKDGSTLGTVNIVRNLLRPSTVNSSIAVVTAGEKLNGLFLYYLFQGSFWRSTIQQLKGGMGVPHLFQDDLIRLPLALPPAVEQSRIGDVLDRETAKIDALAEDYRSLIELLKEKRQAVISHAVTKGLDPTVPMKDSGVDWLREVPEHWEVISLGAVFTEANEQGGEHLPILSVSIHDGVSDREYDDDELDRKVTRSDDRSKYKAVRPGDLVYNMMRAWQGGFGSVQVFGQVSPAYVVARPQLQVLTDFVEHILRHPSAVEEMRRHSHGVTDFRLRLYWPEFKGLKIALPPLREQDRIMAAVSAETQSFDALISDAEEAITLLQERRTALISAAVTGKIDVRGLVAREDAS